MNISTHTDRRDGSICELAYDEKNQWLRATWLGYVDPHEAHEGAVRYLNALRDIHCSCLLNDNSRLRGPWFDSLEWLHTVWMPCAVRMGLRYVAHVTQQDDLLHEVVQERGRPLAEGLQFQVFGHVHEAEAWLRDVRQADAVRG